jgi:C-terminal processing protease CtpA/Prc
VQELIPLDDDGGELKLTVAYYYLPSGRLVHRKKGATDWGVEPQIVVPMDDDAQREVMETRADQEAIRAAGSRPSTRPLTTQPVDAQLEQALNMMKAGFVLNGDVTEPTPAAPAVPSGPTSQPTASIR